MMKNMFLLGAVGYPALELLWRKRTHWSMSLAGGASASLIGQVQKLPLRRGKRALLCGAGITAIEGMCGLIVNRKHQVWDYRREPLNWRGHVCLPFSLMWCGLSYGLLSALDTLER